MNPQDTHRRELIIDTFTDLFKPLVETPEVSGFPFQIKGLQHDFEEHTILEKQGRIPAILIASADGGSAPDAPAVGYTDENFPLSVTAVLKKGRGVVYNEGTDAWEFIEKATKDRSDMARFEREYKGTTLIKQYSNAHYTIGAICNANRRLVEGVEGMKIRDWRNSEEKHFPHLYVKFRVIVKHRYHASSNV